MNSLLASAISKAKSYNGSLSQAEYDELIKWSKVYCPDGKEACNALATAKSYNYKQFATVRSRNTYAEDRYGALGSSSNSSGGCYLTSACMEAQGDQFDDQGYYLQILREFRDTYVKLKYPADTDIYYKNAPRLVAILKTLPDYSSVMNDIYHSLVVRAAELIKNGANEEAYILYKGFSLKLMKRYLPSETMPLGKEGRSYHGESN